MALVVGVGHPERTLFVGSTQPSVNVCFVPTTTRAVLQRKARVPCDDKGRDRALVFIWLCSSNIEFAIGLAGRDLIVLPASAGRFSASRLLTRADISLGRTCVVKQCKLRTAEHLGGQSETPMRFSVSRRPLSVYQTLKIPPFGTFTTSSFAISSASPFAPFTTFPCPSKSSCMNFVPLR